MKCGNAWRFILLLSGAAILQACSGRETSEMTPLASDLTIDLARYMGVWHVIANIPYFAENGKLASRDVYRLDANGNVETRYLYRKTFDGAEKSMHSLGLVQPGSRGAYWIVRFLWLIRADYLIVDIAPDYSWVLVGQPSRKLGWILARSPGMDDALYTMLLDRFRACGYDPERFRRVPQFAEQVGKPGFQ
jgi:apolipoprotein D and lipocalin family protein